MSSLEKVLWFEGECAWPSGTAVKNGKRLRFSSRSCSGFARFPDPDLSEAAKSPVKTAKKPFLVIISITDKKKKIKKTKKLFPARAHFLRFREFPGMSIVKTDGQQNGG